MMRRLVTKYNSLRSFWRSVIQAIILSCMFSVASIGESIVQDIFEKNNWQFYLLPKLIIFIIFVSLFTIIYTYIQNLSDEIRKDSDSRKNTLQYASSLMDQYTSKMIEQIDRRLSPVLKNSEDFKAALVAELTSSDSIVDIVRKLYQLFEAHYGQSEKIDNRIDFEVTLFAPSYHDGELTIVAYGNRNGRHPTSMNIRAKEHQIYRKTIAYSLYQEHSPMMRLIPDTSAPSTGYTELYAGQKERICSTIIFPVMSDRNSILGVVVVHCNRKNFFTEADRKFWNELLEIFAKRVALEKIQLDAIFDKERAKNGTWDLFDTTIKIPF